MQQMTHNDVFECLVNSPSDKQGRHNYGFIYNLLLNYLYHKCSRPLKILEIGILSGHSLVAFASLEIVEEVVGIDKTSYVETAERVASMPNISCYYPDDAYIYDTIDFLKKRHGQFDCIIDDGSHDVSDQLFFIQKYNTLLSPCGALVCEDVLSSFLFEKLPPHAFILNTTTASSRSDDNLIIIPNEGF